MLRTAVLIGVALPCCGERLSSSQRAFPADGGLSGGRLVYDAGFLSAPDALRGPLGDVAALRELRRTTDGGRTTVFFESTDAPGVVAYETDSGLRVVLNFYAGPDDLDGDGFPDAAELNTREDRQAFRAWFVRIAEAQFVQESPAWGAGERDCAGLIRFAYREALKEHDQEWQSRTGIPIDKNLMDVVRFRYPSVPVLGARLFRVRPRSGASIDPENFSEFASAAYLRAYQTVAVTREMRNALPGDLLFFEDEGSPEFPYHSMIVARPFPDLTLVYHTGGPDGMKRVKVDYLEQSPDPRWRPTAGNPHFLGVFRFRILE
ncbi:MAG: DUF1175 family protein [Spirochaetales bacterium]|nr:DUF1175 family protein [Spirochaetales bacterium]